MRISEKYFILSIFFSKIGSNYTNIITKDPFKTKGDKCESSDPP
jgi:hypothetical protein